MQANELKVIAHIRTDFPEKFGIPRQSSLIRELKGRIVFEPAYRSADALKGLEGFNYIWLLWEFEGAKRDKWSATVMPPRLGGKTHVGVFATRSPFRPNNIGLSSVHLDEIEYTGCKGVIFATQKYCEPYDYLFSVYKKALDEKGIPVLQVQMADSTDGSGKDAALEAFADII